MWSEGQAGEGRAQCSVSNGGACSTLSGSRRQSLPAAPLLLAGLPPPLLLLLAPALLGVNHI